MRRGGVAALAAVLSIGAVLIVGPGVSGASGIKPASRSGAQALELTRARALVQNATRRGGATAHVSTSFGPAAAATPSSASVDDPAADNDPDFDPRGDLLQASIRTDASHVTVSAVVTQFDDPQSSPNWQGFFTTVLWGLDTNGDAFPDFVAFMANDGTNVFAQVADFSGTTVLCDATPSWDAVRGSYTLVFARSCIGSPHTVAAQGFADYETATTSSLDITDFTGAVAPPVAAQKPRSGYWMLGSDGHVYPFGGAVGFSGLVPFATAMTPSRDGNGYWVVNAVGQVFAYGSAHFHGGSPSLGAGEIVSTISATPNGGGYWLFTNRGRVFAFGNAHSFGDMSGVPLNGPIVASVATPSGNGYYMVGSDGGIFCFGDARFHGSTGGIRLNKPVVGIAPTPDGRGYWLVATDGGVFAFNAPFRGSMGGAPLNQAVDGLVAYGNGYLMAAADGGVFDFSNKVFAGSLANNPPSAPIIGLAAFST